MNIRPLKNKVALKEVKKETTSASGIVLMSDVMAETPEFGIVAIGPDVVDVKVGDRVFIELGKSVMADSGTLVIEDKYILTVIEND
jgi:co-chaperonin GroES (HSP10)